MRLAPLAIAAALVLGAAGCGGSTAPIEPRSPVRGAVTVAGKPAAGVIVRFHLEPGTADERAPKLVETTTDAAGQFSVSQNAPGDGLAPGKYAVTFFWPPGGDPDAPEASDQLRGRYAKRELSKTAVEVKAEANQLAPFELK